MRILFLLPLAILALLLTCEFGSTQEGNAKFNSSHHALHHYFTEGSSALLKCGENSIVLYPTTLDILKNCYAITYLVNNKTKNEVPEDKKLCPFLCMAQRLELMMKNGTLDRVKIREFFKIAIPIPSSKTDEIIHLVYACADQHESLINPTNCSTAKPFIRCTFKKVFSACGSDLSQVHAEEDQEVQ